MEPKRIFPVGETRHRGNLTSQQITDFFQARDYQPRRVIGSNYDGNRGDHNLNPDMLPDGELRHAAVLVGLVERPDGLTVLLTQRTAHLSHHPGQISFPGGHIEEDDDHPEAAALRETEEEIGLAHDHIKIIGRLDHYVTRTGFLITPVVAIITPPFDLKPDPEEVAEVFEVPLSFLLDASNHERHSHEFEGRKRYFYAMPYQGHYIWGATAGMLVNLYDLLVKS